MREKRTANPGIYARCYALSGGIMLPCTAGFCGGVESERPFPVLPHLCQESSMKLTKKAPAKTRAVVISSLAAKLLGHSRVAGIALSAQRLSATFPAFNSQELANAVTELVDKQLFTQKGVEGHAIYSLTDYGRDGRVAIA
jgi:hypothetical protein